MLSFSKELAKQGLVAMKMRSKVGLISTHFLPQTASLKTHRQCRAFLLNLFLNSAVNSKGSSKSV